MRTRTLVLVLVMIAFLAGSVGAQEGPRLMLDSGFSGEKLQLKQIGAEARIIGNLAETRLTMTFFNPGSRNLAGELVFPLPEGAQVSGYALDVNGVLVDGVAVEKEKARVVFEKEMRKGVDPGLIEQVAGNSFKTRVFPIPPNGTRTVRVIYVSDLQYPAGKPVYHLPLYFKEPVGRFTLRLEAVKTGVAPKAVAGKLGDLTFKPWQEAFVAEAKAENVSLAEDVRVELPQVAEAQPMLEKGPRSETYFVVTDHPKAPAGFSAGEKPVFKHLAIFWDASTSREKDDHQREVAFLKNFFADHKEAMTVDLILVRNVLGKARTFSLQNGNVDELLKAILGVEYDGGTQLGALQIPEKADAALLFTDGISNFGREMPEKLQAPLYIFTNAARSNVPFLQNLAGKSGGELFNLMALKDPTILDRLGREAYRFLKAEVVEGTIDEVFPSMPQAVNGPMLVAGKLLSPAGKVTLHYGSGGKTRHTVDVALKAGDAVDGTLLQRFWAQKKLAELLVNAQKNEREIVSLGKKYGLVTPKTSLIVLERLDQYLEHEIEPPACLPEMRKQYWDTVENKKRGEEKVFQSKLASVLAMWQERVKWWETDFTYAKNLKVNEDGEDRNNLQRSSHRLQSVGMGAPEGVPEAPMSEAEPTPDGGALMPQSLSTPSPVPMSTGGAMREERGRTAGDRFDGPSEESKSDSQPPSKPAGSRPVEPGVALKGWDPSTPYLAALKKADSDKVWAVYLKQKKENSDAAGFYLDCADFFLKNKQKELGLQVLSNVAEIDLENAGLLRILGHRLNQIDELVLSRMTFETVQRLRPEEPQSSRDLALVLAREGSYTRALELLKTVIMHSWDRFPEIEVIALMEYNSILAKSKEPVSAAGKLDERLVKNLDVDLRIIMTWDTDMADMDLWIIEPSGEKAFYSHPNTTIGGRVSRDFTQGYGPEEYCVKKAMKGMYKIQSNYYGASSPTLSGPVTVQVEIFSNFGRPNEKRQSMTLRLKESRDTFTIGEVEF